MRQHNKKLLVGVAAATVFLGLIAGHNLCLPNKLPTKYANTSVNVDTAKTNAKPIAFNGKRLLTLFLLKNDQISFSKY